MNNFRDLGSRAGASLGGVGRGVSSMGTSLRDNLYLILALLVIIALSVGYAFFYLTAIAPGMQAQTRLDGQVADARRQLANAQRVQGESPETLRPKIQAARDQLTNSLNLFLTDLQAGQAVTALYQYANASGMTITNLDTQTVPSQGQKDIFNVRTIRVQGQADCSCQIVDFLSRIKESAAKSFTVTNLQMQGDVGSNTLVMDIALFTSPYSAGLALPTPAGLPSPVGTPVRVTPFPTAPVSGPTPSNATVTPLSPGAFPTAEEMPTPEGNYTVYTVQRGDTLYSIARRFGTTVAAIVALNGDAANHLHAGQQLLIPK